MHVHLYEMLSAIDPCSPVIVMKNFIQRKVLSWYILYFKKELSANWNGKIPVRFFLNRIYINIFLYKDVKYNAEIVITWIMIILRVVNRLFFVSYVWKWENLYIFKYGFINIEKESFYFSNVQNFTFQNMHTFPFKYSKSKCPLNFVGVLSEKVIRILIFIDYWYVL